MFIVLLVYGLDVRLDVNLRPNAKTDYATNGLGVLLKIDRKGIVAGARCSADKNPVSPSMLAQGCNHWASGGNHHEGGSSS